MLRFPEAIAINPIAIDETSPDALAPEPIEIPTADVEALATVPLVPIFSPPVNTIPPAALDMFNPLPEEEGMLTTSVLLPSIS
jgi:hypothetical protein